MATTKTYLYADTLFFDALTRAINEATVAVEIATFVFKTSYTEHTRAHDIVEALKAAAGRGVPVYVVLNYSQFEPDVCVDNYRTGQELAAAGCQVCMGPRNVTFHAKLALIDYRKLFIGSDNLTRGALTFNRETSVYTEVREMAKRANRYFITLWDNSTKSQAVAPPSGAGGAVQIALTEVTTSGAEVQVSFNANHTPGRRGLCGDRR